MNLVQKTIFSCILGFSLAYYTAHVAFAKSKNPAYKSYCDFNQRFSCSEVFVSKFANGFMIVEKYLGASSPLNLPNGVYAVPMYIFILLGTFLKNPLMLKLSVLLSFFAATFALAGFYNSFFISPVLCVVCWLTHSNNLWLFSLTWRNLGKSGEVRMIKGKVK